MSLMVRGFLLGLVPMTLSVISAACGFGITCLEVDAAGLNQVIEWAAAVVQLVLTAVASLWFAWGLIRKLWNTISGWFSGGYTT